MLEVPEWLQILRERIAAATVSAVARDLGYSPSVISQAAAEKYPGDLVTLERRVIERFGARTVECPVLSEIQLSRCAAERVRPFAATNPVRVALFRACQTCPNNPGAHPRATR